ncbi:MAG: 4-hydroxythreonine-4-phosphate dehydrogenase PdxA [Herminiimonas sp.]|nr:4-hydroxythreonine-4-phosphate dehydrogenase PdxA [Herminiimonas sp.]
MTNRDAGLSMRPTIAITCGEPAGIGPEISIRAAWQLRADVNCVLIGDAAFLAMTAAAIDPAILLVAVSIEAVRNDGLPQFGAGRIVVVDCPLHAHVVPGVLDVHNAPYVLSCLDIGIEGALQGWWEAIVTAPLQKSIINDAGVAFTGHTEYLAARTGTPLVVMMLAAGAGAGSGAAGDGTPPLRVALATTHLALKDVPAAITPERLAHVLEILHYDLQRKFGIARPRILVTGLNPHAGEHGYLGREEIDVIEPVLAAQRALGVDVRGPFPADTLFQPKYLRDADCVLAMYHDQGLPVLKFASFGRGVNVTLGLPIIRTSVDHGTALDLAAAGVGHADHGSMIEAISLAAQMASASRATFATPPV